MLPNIYPIITWIWYLQLQSVQVIHVPSVAVCASILCTFSCSLCKYIMYTLVPHAAHWTWLLQLHRPLHIALNGDPICLRLLLILLTKVPPRYTKLSSQPWSNSCTFSCSLCKYIMYLQLQSVQVYYVYACSSCCTLNMTSATTSTTAYSFKRRPHLSTLAVDFIDQSATPLH